MNHPVHALGGLLAAMLVLFTDSPAAAQDGGWRLEPDARIEVQTVSAQTTTRDNDLIVDGEAISVRAQVGLALEKRGMRLRLEADRIEVFRLGEGRRNIARDRFTATVQTDIEKDWELQLQARHFDDVVSVESNDTDEWQGSARLAWEPNGGHRVRVQGTWRTREYDNGPLAETTGDGPRVEAQYRRRFGRYHYLAFDLRTESIRSDDPRRGFKRESAGVAYTHPITANFRVRPGIEIIRTRFDDRLTPAGEQRADNLVAPEVKVLLWPGKWRLEAEAKYIFAGSNETIREREGYRLSLSVGYAF